MAFPSPLPTRRGWPDVAWALLTTLPLLFSAPACSPGAIKSGTDGPACTRDADCDAPAVCLSGVCSIPCNSVVDCPTKAHTCQFGFCERIVDAECAANDECTSPGTCERADNAVCREGVCQYGLVAIGTACPHSAPCTNGGQCDADGLCQPVPLACNTPPDLLCLGDNDILQLWSSPGSCIPATGECVYESSTVPCDNCAETCLARCTDLICDDVQGGCRNPGQCIPAIPAYCEYSLPTTPPLTCDVPSGPPDNDAGTCDSGLCVGCTFPSDCTEFPTSYDLCFDVSCSDGLCDYVAAPSRICDPARCEGNTSVAARTCGSDGSCADAGSTLCDPYDCDDATGFCIISCVDDSNCAAATFCNASQLCEPLRADGADCSGEGNDACASGYCDGQRCCSAGDCCNDAVDCPAEYAVASLCTDINGSTSCQGQRLDAACVNHVCTNTSVDDDRGCDGVEHTCPNNLDPVICSNQEDQPSDPQNACLTSCGNDNDCIAGYVCDGSNSCVVPAGAGADCSSVPCGGGLKCENDVCCLQGGPTCCTNDSQCAGNLACNSSTFSCRTTCSDFTSTQCRAPTANYYCLNDACYAELSPGAVCSHPSMCASGNCVEGVCCNSACGATCASCLQALTGSADGTCAAINSGNPDTQPSGLCTISGTGCTGDVCACDGSSATAAACKSAVGQGCSASSECISGVCECANEQCTARVCATTACPECKYTTNGTNCVFNLGSSVPYNDSPSCDGAESCYSGTCLLDVGQICTSAGQCGTGLCECSNSSCGQRVCSQVACAECRYTTNGGSSCTGNLGSSVSCDDGNACTQTDTCGGGSCNGSNPVSCTNPPGDCYVSPGSCNPGNGSCSYSYATSGTACTTDANECTRDVCNTTGTCTHPVESAGEPCTSDGDRCTLDQCDGAGACVHPPSSGDPEGPAGLASCTDGIDNDCDTLTDAGDPECDPDRDNDGYEVTTNGGEDCNDLDAQVNPIAVEGPSGHASCSDGKDNDCDGDSDGADWGCGQTAYVAMDNPTGTEDEMFGDGLAVSGNTLVIGAPTLQASAVDTGRAYVYVHNGSSWQTQQTLEPSPAVSDRFGESLDLDGDRLIVGADGNPEEVYFYSRSGSTWSVEDTFSVAATDSDAAFGNRSAISGSVAVATAFYYVVDGYTLAGALFVYRWDGSNWQEDQRLDNPTPSVDRFGCRADIDGNVLVTRNTADDTVPVFRFNGSTWVLEQSLTGDDGPLPAFAHPVVVNGNTIVAGVYNKTVSSVTNAGMAYIFRYSASTWTQTQKLWTDPPITDGQFAWNLSIFDNILVVGAKGENGGEGAVYVYEDSPAGYVQVGRLEPSGLVAGDEFGTEVSVGDSWIAVGAENHANLTGKVWVFPNLYHED